MHYIIFDLELNSKIFKSKLPNEIIEIGAVKVDDKLERIGEFQAFVKPKIFRKLFPIVKRKTNISQKDIDDAENFKIVLNDFKDWIGGHEYVLCSWGHDDFHHLKENCAFNRRSTKWISNHIDIQKQFSKLYGFASGTRSSLSNALELLEIPIEVDLHRADVDARYTYEIFVRIFDKINTQIEKAN